MSISTVTIGFNDLVSELIGALSTREREVIVKRFALEGTPKATLDAIGKAHNITRERVRQIENEGLKKIREVGKKNAPADLETLVTLIDSYIEEYGGFVGQEHLIDALLHTKDVAQSQALQFLLDEVLFERFVVHAHPEFDTVWTKGTVALEDIVEIGKVIADLINAKSEPISFDDLYTHTQSSRIFPKID